MPLRGAAIVDPPVGARLATIRAGCDSMPHGPRGALRVVATGTRPLRARVVHGLHRAAALRASQLSGASFAAAGAA